MRLEINEEVVSRYKAEGLSIEYVGTVMLILYSLYEKDLKILDIMDDGNKEKRLLTLYQYLNRKKFLEQTDDSHSCLYKLTEKAIELIKFIDLQKEKEEEKQAVAIIDNKESKDIQDWISEYIGIFPKGKVNGRYLRTNDVECTARMTIFIKENKCSKEIVLKATKAYIDNQEHSPEGHTYTRNSTYFISKYRTNSDKKSDLATWCRIIQDEGVLDPEYIERDVI